LGRCIGWAAGGIGRRGRAKGQIINITHPPRGSLGIEHQLKRVLACRERDVIYIHSLPGTPAPGIWHCNRAGYVYTVHFQMYCPARLRIGKAQAKGVGSAGRHIYRILEPLSCTMVYARAHDQTVAEDYFAAMERVEQRLDIVPEPRQKTDDEVVKVQEPVKLIRLIEQLEMPKLCLEERLGLTLQLRELFGVVQELEPAMAWA
jgi:hypothetical protein